MRLGLITYDTRHLKTEQVALGLRQRGYRDLVFFSLPFVERPAREVVFAHRPDMMNGAHTREVADAVGAKVVQCESAAAIPASGADVFLILGAGLLPAEFVSQTQGRVVNAHPGLIPLVRGLDAFKWAIFDGMPVGNSLHFIDEEADAGVVIGTEPTPLFSGDTLEIFARRHYELEILMMIDFEAYLRKQSESRVSDAAEVRPARMRMPADKQRLLHEKFESYKARVSQS